MFVLRNSVRHDAAASAFGASQAFGESRYRGSWTERLRAEGASVVAMYRNPRRR